jgi:hypothetical protein
MKIDRRTDGILVTMPGYAQECVSSFLEHDSVEPCTTPAEDKLFDFDESSPMLDSAKAKTFHSLAAKVLYLATKTRPDIMPTVCFLMSRARCCTSEDWAKLKYLFSYLSCTTHYGIFYRSGAPATLSAYVDASHGTHMEDGTSRTGIVITMAGGAVCFKSMRQTLVTTSSTEAELVALSEGSKLVMWLRYLMSDLNLCDLGPTVVYQDNTSAISIIMNDKTKQQRTRHINCKYFAVRQYIREKCVILQHLAGTEMLADILTKGVDESTLKHLLPRMMCTTGQ